MHDGIARAGVDVHHKEANADLSPASPPGAVLLASLTASSGRHRRCNVIDAQAGLSRNWHVPLALTSQALTPAELADCQVTQSLIWSHWSMQRLLSN